MAVSEIPSADTCDQREASLKASISETMTIKLRMNSVWYFFSNIKTAKNDTYSWQADYTWSFTGDRNGACPDPTHAKNFCSFSLLSWFNPSQQPSTTQLLTHFPPTQWDGEKNRDKM